LLIAAQDQALDIRYHRRNIKKQPFDCKCSMCCKADEHIVLQRITLPPSEYTNRHNKVVGYILNLWSYMLLTGTVDIYLKGS